VSIVFEQPKLKKSFLDCIQIYICIIKKTNSMRSSWF